MIPCVAFSSLCALERSLNPLITITTKVQTKITSPKIEISNDDNAPFLSSFFWNLFHVCGVPFQSPLS